MTGLLALGLYGAVFALLPKIAEAQAEHKKTKKWPPENRREGHLLAGMIDYGVELLAAMATGAGSAVAVAKVGVELTVAGVQVGGPNVQSAIVAGIAAPAVLKLLGKVVPGGGGDDGGS
jgi:hypothetical protein